MNTLQIDKNRIEPFVLLAEKELFLVDDLVWYEEIPQEGGNKFRYLNVFDFPEDKPVPDSFREEFYAMHRVVSKGGYTMDLEGMCAINLYQLPHIRLKNIVEKLNPKYISFWGADPQKFRLTVQPMKGLVWNGIKILRLESPEKIQADSALAAKCEQFLKYMFGIK